MSVKISELGMTADLVEADFFGPKRTKEEIHKNIDELMTNFPPDKFTIIVAKNMKFNDADKDIGEMLK